MPTSLTATTRPWITGVWGMYAAGAIVSGVLAAAAPHHNASAAHAHRAIRFMAILPSIAGRDSGLRGGATDHDQLGWIRLRRLLGESRALPMPRGAWRKPQHSRERIEATESATRISM